MITEPWEHTLLSIQPSYFKWKDAMEKGPTIKPVLTKIKNQWRLTLEEEWHHDSGGSYTVGSIMLDDIVEWTEKELTKWEDCHRTAWDMWQFKSKRDAEKFITLFHITWVQ